MAEVMYRGTGRRKDAIARVRLVPGEGKVMINERPMSEYFGKKTLEMLAMQPLELTENTDRFDVICKVEGGGISGQAGAVCLGIARALLVADDKLRSPLKKAGFLTRDSRMKERKKYGLKKARKASQFSKR